MSTSGPCPALYCLRASWTVPESSALLLSSCPEPVLPGRHALRHRVSALGVPVSVSVGCYSLVRSAKRPDTSAAPLVSIFLPGVALACPAALRIGPCGYCLFCWCLCSQGPTFSARTPSLVLLRFSAVPLGRESRAESPNADFKGCRRPPSSGAVGFLVKSTFWVDFCFKNCL
ncbi:hypothetical protein NDU88_007150 [Pleurodeles waltl]|uniref:Uncharacterized protein n=1 Tax=Pleurodeles waltl TaxID=8319 RepID=A0AAV7PL02_PLEWA|nr:hypothetical protein NDU88_007150 [Pleurodeles waltl]